MTQKKHYKILLLGDSQCGKTSLLEVYKMKRYTDEYIPAVIDSFTKDFKLENKTITIMLWDNSEKSEYDSFRALSYCDVDLVFLCYSVNDKTTLSNITIKWMPIIRSFYPIPGIFLIGLKLELRDLDLNNVDANEMNLKEDGIRMKEIIGAAEFFECSSKKYFNVNEIFNAAALWIKKNRLIDNLLKKNKYGVLKNLFKKY